LGDRCGGSLLDEGLSLRGCMWETLEVEGPGPGESSRGEAEEALVAVAVGAPRDFVMVSSPLEALSLQGTGYETGIKTEGKASPTC